MIQMSQKPTVNDVWINKTLKKDITFRDLNFSYPKHSFEGIPLHIHIGGIKTSNNEELDFEVFPDDEFAYEHEKRIEIDFFKRNFSFINIKDKNFGENFNENFLEHMGLDHVDDIMRINGCDEFFLIRFNNYIDEKKSVVWREFIRRLNILFNLNKKKPSFPLKKSMPKTPEKVQDYLSKDYTYIITQLAIEYNTSTPIFPENINKSIIEWSARELEYRMAFMTNKTRMENLETEWQAKVNEDMMEKDKGK